MVSPTQAMMKVKLSHTFHEAQMGYKFIATLSRITKWSTSSSDRFTRGRKLQYPLQRRFLYLCAPTIDNNAIPICVTRALHITIVHLIINLQTLVVTTKHGATRHVFGNLAVHVEL